MVNGKKVVVVLPAYNAAATLRQTVGDIPMDLVDSLILTDDASGDETLSIAHNLSIDFIIQHENNKGYGANQKSCYQKAIDIGADIIIMLHPDYQYTPKLIPSMVYLIAYDIYSVVLGSRILGGGALKGGMPRYKYIANRLLTFFQNVMTGAKLSEYHTGYRAFSTQVLQKIDYKNNSDGFIFDNEILSQIIMAKYTIAEITCPTKYFKEASSINLANSIVYGLGVLKVSLIHFLHKTGIMRSSCYHQHT